MYLSEWREFPSAPCLAGEKKLDSSRLDVVEIARVPDMLPSLFPSWSGYRLISTPVSVYFSHSSTNPSGLNLELGSRESAIPR